MIAAPFAVNDVFQDSRAEVPSSPTELATGGLLATYRGGPAGNPVPEAEFQVARAANAELRALTLKPVADPLAIAGSVMGIEVVFASTVRGVVPSTLMT